MTSRQTARVIELHGNASKVDVDARARREVRPDPVLPTMPAWLTHPVARSTWKYLAPELAKDALLTKRDRETFAFLCSEVAIAVDSLRAMQPDRRRGFALTEVDASHQGRTRRSPHVMNYRQAVDGYRRLAAEFGLSPRMRLPLELGAEVVTDDDDDEDSEIFGD